METAADLAKKYGLEYYLNRPAELNDVIFHLLLLQETIQLEQAGRLKVGAAAISLKRAVQGKFVVACSGDRTYRYAVETALKAGTTVIPMLQQKRFVQTLRSMGVPDDKIADYCDSIMISDDTHCLDQE